MLCWCGLLAAALALPALPWRWLSSVGSSGRICEAGGACSWQRIDIYARPVSPEDRQLRESCALKATSARIEELKAAGRRPVGLYIGTNDLTDGDIQALTTLPFAALRTILVEPQAAVLPKLRERAAAAGLGDAEVINAAVCPNSTGDFVMYGFSQRLIDDFPGAATANLSHLTSLKSTWAAKQARRARRLKDYGMGDLTVKQLLSYVEEMRVRCVTPYDLLRELGAQAQDVAILIVDAEGYDPVLIRLFLELEGFRPSYLQFEGGLFPTLRLMQALANSGYDIHQHRHDFVALPSVA
uniref:Methyltransferase FkbM domain-containing protein n=1 Tax=Alexandrium catenella TaxID=2925 RepID=A0A7S1WEV5_ALECA|mmetsp:Transcript_5548/g.14762  ORF Transcript_5548/g.14762 Transcript_5548/m.14762 type:complete len:298 (+) Transcript_5548:36-929(+)